MQGPSITPAFSFRMTAWVSPSSNSRSFFIRFSRATIALRLLILTCNLCYLGRDIWCVLVFPASLRRFALSQRSIGNGHHLSCVTTVRGVSFGMLLVTTSGPPMIHSMTAALHASCYGMIWVPWQNGLDLHHHQLGQSGNCHLRGSN